VSPTICSKEEVMYTTGSGMCQRRDVMEDMQLHRRQPQVHTDESKKECSM